jgi:hypothetical protein
MGVRCFTTLLTAAGVKLGFMSAFVKAAASSLVEIPAVNAGAPSPLVRVPRAGVTPHLAAVRSH